MNDAPISTPPTRPYAQTSNTRAWPWTPFLKASAALHLGAGALTWVEPALWPWTLGAVAANNLAITASGLWPRSTWLGPNLLRLPPSSCARAEVALTIDDGPDPEITPRVLDLLDAHHVRATFFCIAQHAAQHPALAREIVRRGHSLQNHSHRHSHRFSLMGPSRLRLELTRSQNVLADITGESPRFFRAPAGLRNVFLAPVLHEMNLTLVAWSRRGFDTVQRDPRRVLERLTHRLAAGDILLLHDHHCARTEEGRPVTLEVLPALLQTLERATLHTVTLPEACDR